MRKIQYWGIRETRKSAFQNMLSGNELKSPYENPPDLISSKVLAEKLQETLGLEDTTEIVELTVTEYV